ncbi:MAG: carboxypeptidase-like regulatory domain-containing protein [Saprospiraceae bacterium]|nr:carboxypeptidase-like regulatory domain-containing protein [Saprospiraceae bacterium]
MKFLMFIFLFCSVHLEAQNGVLSGTITDKSTGETVIGATVVINKAGQQVTGTTTDFDGKYHINLAPGVYEVVVSYLSYGKQTITDLEIIKGKTNLLDIALEEETAKLMEVVVTAEVVKNTEAALISLQRKAFSIQDGVSSQQINRTGSSNAADAMRQSTGAVIESGKFIVMRGLGDRYSLSQLNGITLPSTDPYRNSTSLDLIPAQMIDNIVTIKTFTPDLPGNFSGGLININTKTIPENFNMAFSVSTEYNTQSSFIDDFIAHPTTGKTDWLGFEDGTRDQPEILLDPNIRNQLSSSTYLQARDPNPAKDGIRSVFDQTSKALSNEFVPVSDKTKQNLGFNFSLGDRLKFFGKDLGYTLALNYSSNYSHYEGGEVATYVNNSTDKLFPYQSLLENKSVYNPAVGGLFNLALKFSENHALNGNIIFNNDAEIIGRQQSGEYLGQVSNSFAEFNTNSLEFIQRQVKTFQLGGKHVFPNLGNATMDWTAGTSTAFQKEPDLRYFAYTVVEENEIKEYYINNAEIAYPYHFFRNLEDELSQAKIDISIPFATGGNPSSSNKIKFGGFFSSSNRDFGEYRYQLNNSGLPSDRSFTSFQGDFSGFFDKKNFGIVDTTFDGNGNVQRYVTGLHYINQINARNFYQGDQKIAAGYLMAVYNINSAIKLIGGARVETTDLTVKSEEPTVPEGRIDQTDILYSLNAIYSISERANFRAAVSQTLARPNMRELAPFIQFDTKNGFFHVGNPDLKRSLIRNYDLRYEFYPKPGELLAVSGFYKKFNDPIIRQFNPRATIPELSFINVDDAEVYGMEIELRKSLNFISPFFKQFYLSANLALIHSEYDIPTEEVQGSKNIDPTYDADTRPFQGQAPYVVNAILSYINPDKGWESSLAFNISGKKLYNISLFATPDVYEQPFPLLNFKISKRIADHYQIGFTARNILDTLSKKTQDFKGKEYMVESNKLGTGLSLSLSYLIK